MSIESKPNHEPKPIQVETSPRDRKMLDALSVFGGSFDYLANEPDLYEDGESIFWPETDPSSDHSFYNQICNVGF